LRRAADRVPHRYDIHYDLATAHFARKETDQAVAVLQEFCRRNPDHAQARIDLAAFYQASGNEEAAIVHYRRALANRPAVLWPYAELARLLFVRRQDEEALKILGRGLDLATDSTVAQFVLRQGLLFLETSEHERALPCFELAAQHVADLRQSPVFLLQLGALYERTGRFAEAEAVFLECLQSHPRTHEVLNYLAYMWAEQGVRLDEALAYVRTALEMQPDQAAYIDTLGWIYYRQGRYRAALAELKRAQRMLPQDAVVADHVGDVYQALDDRENALRYWKISLALDATNEKVARKVAEASAAPEAP
jgi:tetratricopeptide (TPR) repeat protein